MDCTPKEAESVLMNSRGESSVDEDYETLLERVNTAFHPFNYASDNYYAYDYDKGTERLKIQGKNTNFVPTRDRWCLYCNTKDVRSRCSKCKSVWYCDERCQKNSWDVHKKHCGRDLFTICATCGNGGVSGEIKCDDCPVKFCSEDCKSKIIRPHKEYEDCKYFAKMFGS